MSEHGTLNGQPLGPDLPDPIPCERCGHPIWLPDSITAYSENGEPRHLHAVPLELSLQPPPAWSSAGWGGWTLQPHQCRPAQVWDPVSQLRAHRYLR